MAETSVEKQLRKLPEFKALEGVYAALTPLSPEGRRKVIEAIHALLPISAGKQGADQKGGRAGKGAKKPGRRS